jgi:hypothetical protein
MVLVGLLFSCSVFAQSKFGDWFLVNAEDRSGDVIAGTLTNKDGGEVLAYRCYVEAQECAFILRSGTTCEADGTYPMLLNASVGAILVTGVCVPETKGEQLLSRHDMS